jgi:hypothetical protein
VPRRTSSQFNFPSHRTASTFQHRIPVLCPLSSVLHPDLVPSCGALMPKSPPPQSRILPSTPVRTPRSGSRYNVRAVATPGAPVKVRLAAAPPLGGRLGRRSLTKFDLNFTTTALSALSGEASTSSVNVDRSSALPTRELVRSEYFMLLPPAEITRGPVEAPALTTEGMSAFLREPWQPRQVLTVTFRRYRTFSSSPVLIQSPQPPNLKRL